MNIKAIRLAIRYEDDAFSLDKRLMGRQSAGNGFLRAIANTRPTDIWGLSWNEEGLTKLKERLSDYGSPGTNVRWVSLANPSRIQEAQLFYHADPNIGPVAWRRLHKVHNRAYGICGITHTISSAKAMSALSQIWSSPIEDWDAIICTSHAVQRSVRNLFASSADFAKQRFGLDNIIFPHTPIIPLGIHCSDFDFAESGKHSARRSLSIDENSIVVLFAGRISADTKAHPIAMYSAIEQVARDHPITLLQAGAFAPGQEAAFKSDAATLCPSATHVFVDGHDASLFSNAWAAADIFTSLSDNVQESFGITPVEAMAAGLPCVVSDWDGYRDTVRHGVDGFRIPTITPANDPFDDFQDFYERNGESAYGNYCGLIAQYTAVDIKSAVGAYKTLVENPDLRRRMGKSGRARARQDYDWSKVLAKYNELWFDLDQRRRKSEIVRKSIRRLDQPVPFQLFDGYPTTSISMDTRFRISSSEPSTKLDLLLRLKTLEPFSAGLPLKPILQEIFRACPGRWTSLLEISTQCEGVTDGQLVRALAWLSKVGLAEFKSDLTVPTLRGERDLRSS